MQSRFPVRPTRQIPPGPAPTHRGRRARWRTALSLATAGSVAAGLLTAGLAAPAQAAVTDGLALWYRLDETSGTTATDASGHGRNGVVNGTATWGAGQGLAFDGSSTYVKAPDNLMAGLSSITVALDVQVDPAQASPYFIYGFGNVSGTAGNGYLFTTGNGYRTSIATGNWSTEQTTQPAPARNLTRGTWKHLAYTLTGGVGVLYEDGAEVARNTGITILPGTIGGGTTTADYLGRSVYSGDAFFKGRLRDVRVYDRALAATEVAELAAPAVTESLAQDTAALSLGDTNGISDDLLLPTTGTYGARIAWTSSNPSVVSSTGTVTQPQLGAGDATATLTATLSKGGRTTTRTFDVTVAAEFDDTTMAAHTAEALVVHGLGDVRGNLTLPVTGDGGTTVAWASDAPSTISATGTVNRPAAGSAAATVTLTATVTLRAATATRRFTATVPALPAPVARTGYLFSYFTGEGTATGEQVYFALSKGNDPLHWRELNNRAPVLTSTLGEKGLRDPFIIRSPEGDRFYQIATDLRIYNGNGWDAAQRSGSKSIMVWESTDLVHWTDQRLVKVSPDTAGNTWAPEAYYDRALGAYVVFWASQLYDPADTAHTGSSYNRMMYSTTRDFYTFTPAKVWKDPGYAVIDSTVTEHNGTYYRFTKDERGNTASSPCGKFILEEKSASLLNPTWDFVAQCIGKSAISQGEGPTIFKSNVADKWYLFIDEFGGRGYVPFSSTDLDAGTWTPEPAYALPASPRHGTVMPLTQAEYERLLAAYAPGSAITAIADSAVTTTAGTAPTLPPTVTVTYATGATAAVVVTWDAVAPSAYAAPGTFSVLGTVADTGLRAKAAVTVTRPPGDVTPPVVSGSISPAAPASGWYRSGPVTVTATATDDRDGAVTPEARVTGPGQSGLWSPLTGPLALTGDGAYAVELRAVDSSGNVSAITTLTARIDGTAPVSKARVDTATRTVTLLAADALSGLARVEYSVNGGLTWLHYTAPFQAPPYAVVVLYRGVDTAGNVEDTNAVVVRPALAPSTVRATLHPDQVTYGDRVTAKVEVTGASTKPAPTGTVRVLAGAVEVGSGALTKGKTSLTLDRTVPTGKTELTVLYSGDGVFAGSSTTVTLTVAKVRSRTDLSLSSSSVRTGRSVTATVRVRVDGHDGTGQSGTGQSGTGKSGADGTVAGGTVTVRVTGAGQDITFPARLDAAGRATVTIGPFATEGTVSVIADFPGSSTVAASTSDREKVKVKDKVR